MNPNLNPNRNASALQYLTADGLTFETRSIFPSLHMNGARTVTRTEEVISGDFLGFGVAITGSSCYNLALMEAEERAALLKYVYSKDGLGLSVARLTVGASDYSAELYSYDDVEGDVSLEHFSIDRDRAYVIPMLREILAVNPDLYLFSSPWSPPAWMKTGNSTCEKYESLSEIRRQNRARSRAIRGTNAQSAQFDASCIQCHPHLLRLHTKDV